jgi:hypothetical protein
MSFHEAVRPSGSDTRRVAYRTKAICHFSNIGEAGLKSSRIKVEHVFKKDSFFQDGQFSRVGRYFAS